MSSDKKRRRAAREAQGFELFPARCLNCQRYEPPMHGVPPREERAGMPYVPPRCALGGFEVKPASICDRWLGRDGAELEVSCG